MEKREGERAKRRSVKQVNYADFGGTSASYGHVCQADKSKFETLLATKTFKPFHVRRVLGGQLTAALVRESGLREPIIAVSKEGLGIKVPPSTFTVKDVARIIGGRHPVNVIEVSTQSELQGWNLDDWCDYYGQHSAQGVPPLNVISLEFSNTDLRPHVTAPQLVRDLDWIDMCWPADKKEPYQYPQVQNYCLMSAAGSYTDFHIDFGGSSVWYHVLRGRKVFLFAPPTPYNLARYEKWSCSPWQESTFLGDLVQECYKVEIKRGETMIIPTGWIHAVFTPEDSLVFGGNFLHSLNIPLQLEIHCMEVRTHVLPKFRFPHFIVMMWYAASWMLESLRLEQEEEKEDENSSKNPVPSSQSNAVGGCRSDSSGGGGAQTNGTGNASEANGSSSWEGVSGANGSGGVEDLEIKTGVYGRALSSDVAAATASSSNGSAGAIAGAADAGDSTAGADAGRGGSCLVPDAGSGGSSSGDGAAPPRRRPRVAKLCTWEKQGLPSLLAACEAWLGVGCEYPVSWDDAAVAAGCTGAHEMLAELRERVQRMSAVTGFKLALPAHALASLSAVGKGPKKAAKAAALAAAGVPDLASSVAEGPAGAVAAGLTGGEGSGEDIANKSVSAAPMDEKGLAAAAAVQTATGAATVAAGAVATGAGKDPATTIETKVLPPSASAAAAAARAAVALAAMAAVPPLAASAAPAASAAAAAADPLAAAAAAAGDPAPAPPSPQADIFDMTYRIPKLKLKPLIVPTSPEGSSLKIRLPSAASRALGSFGSDGENGRKGRTPQLQGSTSSPGSVNGKIRARSGNGASVKGAGAAASSGDGGPLKKLKKLRTLQDYVADEDADQDDWTPGGGDDADEFDKDFFDVEEPDDEPPPSPSPPPQLKKRPSSGKAPVKRAPPPPPPNAAFGRFTPGYAGAYPTSAVAAAAKDRKTGGGGGSTPTGGEEQLALRRLGSFKKAPPSKVPLPVAKPKGKKLTGKAALLKKMKI